MNINSFSNKYTVRCLTSKDIDSIYDLCKDNKLYYDYCPPFITKEAIAEDLEALPPNTTKEAKYYVGFFDGDEMVAVMDLIDGYPKKDIIFIGFFMTKKTVQNRGLGRSIIADLTSYVAKEGYTAIRLCWVKGNPQAEHFWTINGFKYLQETSSSAADRVILAEKKL